MEARVLAPLIVFALLAQLAGALPLVSRAEAQQPTIFNYIIRDPNIVPGGVFRDPMMGEANTLNPWMYTTSWEYMILGVVYDTLTTVAPDGNIVGILAKSWEVKDNGTVYIFHLYENASWHDGLPVTAGDVAFTYKFLRDYGNLTRFKDYAPYIKDAKALDNYTVEIDLTQPYAPFLTLVASSIFIVPEHIWSKIPPSQVPTYKNEPPVGSGPFIFKEHVPQQYYMLVANPKYHLGRPYIDTYVLPVIPNPDAMLLALKRGDVDDVTWSVPYATIPDLLKDPNIRIWNVTELGSRFMYFNCVRYPMNETLFRQAVHYAINLTEVVNVIYQGYALPGSLGKIPPIEQPWYNPNLPPKEVKYPFNLTKAAELLDQLGLRVGPDGWRTYPNGTPITLTIYSPAYDPLRVRVGDLLASNLRKIGLNVKHMPLEWTTLVSKLLSGDFDMLIIGGLGSIDPDLLRQIFASNGTWNMGHCVIPGLDPLLQQQAVTPDIEARKKIVWRIEEILADYVPLLNFVHQQFVFAYRVDRWAGWVLYPLAPPDNWFSLMSLYNIQAQQYKPSVPVVITYTTTPTPTPTQYTTQYTTTTLPTTTTTTTPTPTTTTAALTTTPTTAPASTGVPVAIVVAGVVAVLAAVAGAALYTSRRK
ncbi:ABC transporter substrate-binding protein [Thermogladius sp.]|uniref:ABC transporter substrate-binding protein n=1 Tax=Thermogladius sp. TaxID=2023064 RepID=UPI003D14641E